jgi:hypothetical protein
MKTTVDEALGVPVVNVDDIFIYNNTKLTGVQFETNAPLLTTVETWQAK